MWNARRRYSIIITFKLREKRVKFWAKRTHFYHYNDLTSFIWEKHKNKPFDLTSFWMFIFSTAAKQNPNVSEKYVKYKDHDCLFFDADLEKCYFCNTWVVPYKLTISWIFCLQTIHSFLLICDTMSWTVQSFLILIELLSIISTWQILILK